MEPTANDNWSIQQIWNELNAKDRVTKPRDYIRASEIGKPFLERYLAMRGVQPTNPYPARVRRIFDCGLIFEDVVERMFRMLGLLIDAQTEVKLQLDGMLPIVGHYDQRVGGKINKTMALQAIGSASNPEWLRTRAEALLERLIQQHPEGLRTLITEIKSVNSMAFWAHKNMDKETGFFKGYPNHKLQILTYLMATGENEGRLFYISKDDLTLMETSIFKDDEKLKMIWEEDIKEMTHFYKEKIEPAPPENFTFQEDKGWWDFNWQIERSPYFTLMTGKATVEEWQGSLRDELKRKNTTDCKGCQKPFMLQTLVKNKGRCKKCSDELKGGDDTHGK